MSNFIAALTIFAVAGSGIVGGTFFAFATFVMPALANRPPAEAAAAMKEINVAILRSPFIAVFLATAVASLVLTAFHVLYPTSTGSYFAIAASAAYLLPCFAVTIAFNVPLNNKLAATRPDDVMAETVWNDYLEAWTRWNHIRTIGGLAAATGFASSLLY